MDLHFITVVSTIIPLITCLYRQERHQFSSSSRQMQSQSVSCLLKGDVIETKRCLTFPQDQEGHAK